MRYLITLLLFITTCTLAFSQNDAKSILDKSAAKIKNYAAIEISFDLTMENPGEGIHENHKGKAYMKGNLYKLNVMGVENYFDGKNIYTYMPEVKEVNIKNPSEDEEEMLNPTKIFNIHNTGFKQKLVSNSNGVAYIELYPNDLKKNFSKIGVWVNTANSTIQKVTSFGKDGNNLIITIREMKQPATIPADSFFKFDTKQHPGVDVVDMR